MLVPASTQGQIVSSKYILNVLEFHRHKIRTYYCGVDFIKNVTHNFPPLPIKLTPKYNCS